MIRTIKMEGIEALLREATKPTLSFYGKGAAYSNGRDFTGTSSFDEAVKLARCGWPEGRKLMVEAMASAATTTARVADYVMDVAGAYPVAALAAAGDPACMVCPAPVSDRVKPIIRLAVNRCASARYDEAELRSYGAAVASYVDALEGSGFRVEIDACVPLTASGVGPTNLSCIIKQAHEPLEVDRIAFCLTHPSYLRRIMFGVIQSRDYDTEGAYHGCGTPYNLQPTDVEHGVLIIPGINIFSPGSSQLMNAEAAAKALEPIIREMLSAHGIKPPELAYGGQASA